MAKAFTSFSAFLFFSLSSLYYYHCLSSDPRTRYRSKINTTVVFPLEGLDLAPFSASPQPTLYSLFAISNHMGGCPRPS